MSDAKLTADIQINFKKKTLETFTKLLKVAEKGMRKLDKYAEKGFKEVDKGAKKATESTKKLTAATKKDTAVAKKRASQATKTSASWGAFPAVMAKVRVGLGLVKYAADKVMKVLAIPVATVFGWTLFLRKIGQGTLQMTNMAKQVGVSTKFLRAFGSVLKDVGFDAERGVDLIEELGNRIGDAVEDPNSTGGLGLSFLGLDPKEMQAMGREDAFKATLKSFQKLKDEGASATLLSRQADEVFGGEGAKVITAMLERGEALNELIASHEKYSVITQQAEKNNKAFNTSFDRLGAVVMDIVMNSLSDSFGTLGDYMDGLLDIFVENKDGITSTLSSVANKITDVVIRSVPLLVKWGVWFMSFSETAIGALSLLMNTVDVIGTVFFAIGKVVEAVFMAIVTGAKAVANIIMLPFDLLTGGMDAVEKRLDKFINSSAVKKMNDIVGKVQGGIVGLIEDDEGMSTKAATPEELKARRAQREANRVANQAGTSTDNSSKTTNNNSGGNNITINVDGGDRDELIGTIKYAAGAAH